MRFNDVVWGALLMLFGSALFVDVQGFPKMPGQHVGPAAMPGALAVGFAVCGAILLWRGLRQRAAAQAAGAAAPPWASAPPWFASPPQVLGFCVLVAVNLLYLLAADRLGFIVVGVIYLMALMRVLRVRWWLALVVAVVMTLLIHGVFYKLLKVPLPWGLLQPISW